MFDYSLQNTFINALVVRQEVKQRRPKPGTIHRGPKGVTYQYYIIVGDKSVQVCKSYFLNTFLISDSRLTRVLKKADSQIELEDLRGRKSPGNKTSEEKLQVIRDHICSYTRYNNEFKVDSDGTYLTSDLNVKKMYEMYVVECTDRNLPYVTEYVYRSVFRQEFNLTFMPKSIKPDMIF